MMTLHATRAAAWSALVMLASLALPVVAQTAPAPAPVAATPIATPAPAPVAPPAQAAQPNMVVVAGTVPDESTRQAILARVRALYGADRVQDQLGVGKLVAPPNWAEHVQRMLQPELKQVSRGQLSIQGNLVELKGEVTSEAAKQELLTRITTQIANPTYTVRNGLRVTASGQELIDTTLANRIVEFEPGSATLTPTGQTVLDQLWPVLQQLSGRRFEVIGHTDSNGSRTTNLALSAARAETVRNYLVVKGLPSNAVSTSGAGPDRPVARNDSAEGRARNRRIEFRVSQ